MSPTEAKRCKECGAPLLSTLERSQAKCTRCLHSARAGEPAKAKPQAIPAKPVPPDVNVTIGDVNIEGQANSVLMACRVSPSTYAKTLRRIEETGGTQSGWIRALIESALT